MFADDENRVLLLAFKGTSPYILGVGGPSADRDRFNVRTTVVCVLIPPVALALLLLLLLQLLLPPPPPPPPPPQDNIMFSCCCGRIPGGWRPVCDCFQSGTEGFSAGGSSASSSASPSSQRSPSKTSPPPPSSPLTTTGKQQCSASCIQNSLYFQESYYNVARKIYRELRQLYPTSQIWFVGHSLGGAVASVMSLTTGEPAVTFEAPGDQLYAKRLGFVLSDDEDDDHGDRDRDGNGNDHGDQQATNDNGNDINDTDDINDNDNGKDINHHGHDHDHAHNLNSLVSGSLRFQSTEQSEVPEESQQQHPSDYHDDHHTDDHPPSPVATRSTAPSPKRFPIYHFGNTVDPIFNGKCTGPWSACFYGGYVR